MNYTEEILTEIKQLALLPSTTKKTVALALGIPLSDLTGDTEAAEAYLSGKITARAQLDNKIVQLSNSGSGPAQTLHEKMMRQNTINEYIEYYG